MERKLALNALYRGGAAAPRRITARRLLATALPLLALALVALLAARPGAAESRDGVIVYSGPDHNIWRIGADGGGRAQLTQDGMSDNPNWLPGGGQIVFSSIRDQTVITAPEGVLTLNQIYLIGADGSAAQRLSDGRSDDRFPVPIAGGGRVVLLRNHNWRTVNGAPVRDTEVGSMRLDGTDYRVHGSQITDVHTRIDRYPARISADGTKIVLIRQAQGRSSQIQVLDVASGQFSTLAIAVDHGAPEGTVEYLWPRFDPQGHIVVLRRSYTFGPVDSSLIRIDVDGKNMQTVAGGLQYESLANGFDVNWAGRTVIGARAPEMPGGLRPEEIYLYDLATGTASPPLDSGHAPDFSPVGGVPPAPSPTAPATAAPTVAPGATGTPPTATVTAPAGAPLINAADPLFYAVWERVDRPVLAGVAARSWVWGPAPRATAHEPYGASTRLVQYFDKARMELNQAGGDKPAYVTNGLLVVEMLSGRVQIGPTQYQQLSPATIPVGGDGAHNPAPSYALLAHAASLAGENRAGAALHHPVTATIGLTGTLGANTFPASERIGYYAAETGHNVPEVFFNFLNQSGQVYVRGGYHNGVVLDWVFTVGYPITEAYWTRMSIAGKVRNVMVQAFQRQVLTYIPDYAAPWNVQFGNVGVEYYQWRYGAAP